MKILGLDIAKCSVTGCLLENRPVNPREFYRQSNFFQLSATVIGVTDLLALQPNLVILEPTGINYSRLWVEVLIKADIEVRFVGHDKLRSYRKHLNLPDKDDKADALALACWGWDYFDFPQRFISIKIPVIARIQDINLRLFYYTRLRNSINNRVKQDLAYQFPEMSGYNTKRRFLKDAPAFWQWLAGDKISLKYDRLLENSCGLGLQDETTFNAQLLVDICHQERELENELNDLLADSSFSIYTEVFELFKFGLRTSGSFLAQIYPLNKFMGDNGKPEIVREMGVNGYTKRYLSLRRFKKMMGLSPVREWSGDKKSYRRSGNQFCRRVWRLWCLTIIEPARARPKNHIGEKLGIILADGRQKKQPGKKTRAKICEKACELLFYELCDRFEL